MKGFVITGTDTGVGKTVFAAALTQALQAVYWKPVQSGLAGETDEAVVRGLTGLADAHFLPSAYRLRTPVSPHLAAALDGVEIDPAALRVPNLSRLLVLEGAGGVMVPLTRTALFIDLFAAWKLPVIVVARTTLGTINHTLLSLEALARRNIPVHGIAFCGEPNAETESLIAERGSAKRLGCLPRIEPLNASTLAQAFAGNFCVAGFLEASR